jgi:hypothetical protein
MRYPGEPETTKLDEATAASLSLTMVTLARTVQSLTEAVSALIEERSKEVLTSEEAANLLGFRSATALSR